MTTLRVLARVVVAGVDLLATRFALALDRWAGRPRWNQEEAERRAAAVGYRGPIDADGFWLEALAAGLIDHDGNPLDVSERERR